MDISSTTEAKSDQQNADDYMGGPKVVTVEKVTKGNADQPVEIHLVEFPGKPFKPSKTCRRVLVACWGPEASAYTGRRMELFRDPEVRWAGEPVGGIRIAKLSHIDKKVSIALTETRGKRKPHIIEPLPDSSAPTPEPTAAQVTACNDLIELGAMWRASGPERRAQIEERVAELKAPERDDLMRDGVDNVAELEAEK